MFNNTTFLDKQSENLFLHYFIEELKQDINEKKYSSTDRMKDSKAYGIKTVMEYLPEDMIDNGEEKKEWVKEKNDIEDPYCKSEASIIEENENLDLEKIHQDRELCDKNPFMTPEYCKNQTEIRIEELKEKQKKNPVVKKSNITTQFKYPGTPDTESDYGHKDDPDFYQRWSDCFAGPEHSSCGCNFVFYNNRSPTVSECVRPKQSKKNTGINKAQFHPQQRLAGEYINPATPYRGLLCYHGLGSGKTILMIGVIAKFMQAEPTRTILVLLKPSLIQNFNDDLAKIDTITLFGKDISDEERQKRIKQQINVITFESIANRLNGFTKWDLEINKIATREKKKGNPVKEHGNGLAGIMDGRICPDTKEEPMLNNTLVIIDEAHNLVTPRDAKYPPEAKAYSVLSALRRALNCRIILLTATPMRNEPFEIGILINMLKHESSKTRFDEVYYTRKMSKAFVDIVDIPETKKLFNETFMYTDEFGNQKIQNEELFMQKCKGLISYYPVDNLYTKFAKKIPHTIEVDMNDNAFMEMRDKMQTEITSLNKVNHTSCLQHPRQCLSSRQTSNVFGHNYKKVDMSIDKMNASKLEEMARIIDKEEPIGKQFAYSFFDIQGVYALSKILIRNGWTKLESYDLRKSLKPAYQNYVAINNSKFEEIFNLPLSDPNCPRKEELPHQKCFVVLGLRESDKKEFALWKEKIIKLYFNIDSNYKGKQINLLIGNKKYSEGISLQAIRSVHVTEPPTSTALHSQVVGRGVRGCSHKLLKFPDEWEVKVYNYISTHPTLAKIKNPSESKEDFLDNTTKISKEINNIHKSRSRSSSNSRTTSSRSRSSSNSRPSSRSRSSRSKSTGGNNKRVSRKQRLINYNPCDKYLKENTCNTSEFCQWGLTTNNEEKCLSLPIDYVIQKLAIARSLLNNRFLDLLQIAAIDCMVFRDLHDDPSRKCFTIGPSSTPSYSSTTTSETESTSFSRSLSRRNSTLSEYKGYNEKPYINYDEIEQSKINDDNTDDKTVLDRIKKKIWLWNLNDKNSDYIKKMDKKCGNISNSKCPSYVECYVSKDSITGNQKCKFKQDWGKNHGKCSKYYNDRETCNQDPMCVWRLDSGFNPTRNIQCRNRYLQKLDEYAFAFGLVSTKSNLYRDHYCIYSLSEEPLKIQKNIQHIFALLKRREISPQQCPDIIDILEELQEIIEYEPDIIRTATPLLKKKFYEDFKRNPEDWKFTHIKHKLVSINEMNSQKKKERKKIYLNVDIKDSEKHSLFKLRNDCLLNKIDYTFHFFFAGRNYYFKSDEKKNASIVLADIHKLKQIHKHIELLDLSIYITFHIGLCNSGACIKRIEVRLYQKIKTNIDLNTPVHTIYVDKDDHSYRLFNEEQCYQLWNSSKLGYPLPFKCKKSKKIHNKIMTNDEPQNCPVEPPYGSIDSSLLKSKRNKRQANQCYLQWLNHEHPKPLEWKYMNNAKDKALKKTVNSTCTTNSDCDNNLYKTNRSLNWYSSPLKCINNTCVLSDSHNIRKRTRTNSVLKISKRKKRNTQKRLSK
mgnify:CR=1 FL=1